MGSEAADPVFASPSSRLVPILENVPLAQDTYRLRLDDPILARTIRPGQFLMVRPGAEGADDPLLGRPLALYDIVLDAAGRPTAVDLVYIVVGRGTSALSHRRPGERLAVWGPLGNGFGPPPAWTRYFRCWRHRADALPGTGTILAWQSRLWRRHRQPPAFSGSPETRGVFSPSATLLYGVRTAAFLAGVDDFRQAGVDVEIATDDGSAGHHGYVTDLLVTGLRAGRTSWHASLAAVRWPCSRRSPDQP